MIAGPYDITFGRPNDHCVGRSQLKKQVRDLGEVAVVQVLCPKIYAQRLEEAFAGSPGVVLHYPLRGHGGWGSMHRWLRDQLS